MADGKFIRCCKCAAVHHVTPFDRFPFFEFSAGEVEEIQANDWRDFMARHNGHRLEPLVATGNDHFPKGSSGDPMGGGYVEASNGKETLLLRRSRRSIEGPVRYEIVQGRLVETGPLLEVQEKEIRKEMKLHFSWAPAAPLGDEKIDLFVALFREVVRDLDPRAVRTGEYSYTDENISYGHLDSAAVAAFLVKCSSRFTPLELESIRRFVESHRDGCDVMALVKRRTVTVEQRAQ